MAPGALSILAPFLGRKSNKKYEKLQADDPEKRRQEATQEEINRLNTKIVSNAKLQKIIIIPISPELVAKFQFIYIIIELCVSCQ